MINLNYKTLVLSVTAASLLAGCALKEELGNKKEEDKLVIYESNDGSEEMSEEKIINMEMPKESMTSFKKSDVVIEDIGEDIYPPKELLEVVDATTFNNQKLGDIVKILTSNFKNTSIVYEPNIDPNIQIYMRTGKMKLYHLLQLVAKNAGYHCYYDPNSNALNFSPFQTRKYRVPAGLFVKKNVEQKLGSSGGTSSATIDLNSESPIDAFNDQLKLLGSSDKLINFDRSAGTLIVKEHPIYMNEIDDFVVNFVQDRSRKFIVETAIFDIAITNDREVGLDLTNFTKAGLNPMNITNLGGAGGTAVFSLGKSQVGSVYNADGTEINYGMNGTSFSTILSMMKKDKNSMLVDKSKTILNNHDVNYIGNGSTLNYIESIEAIVNESGTTTYVPQTAKAFDGITFVSRVDGFKNKDYIEVSLAPAVKNVTIERGGGVAISGSTIAPDLVNEEVRETMSNVNVRDGEIIVLGGLIREEEVTSESRNPLLENIPILKDMLGTKGTGKVKIETVFVVKVSELHKAEQSYQIPSYKTKGELENRF